jgi:hypothetical protein
MVERARTYRGPLEAANEAVNATIRGTTRLEREQVDTARTFYRLVNDILVDTEQSTGQDLDGLKTNPLTIQTGRGRVVAFVEGKYIRVGREGNEWQHEVRLNMAYEDGTKNVLKVRVGHRGELPVTTLPSTNQLRKGINVLQFMGDEYTAFRLLGHPAS